MDPIVSDHAHGHARPDEVAFVESLQAAVANEVPFARILDLAQVNIEPMHADATAVQLSEFVLLLDPRNARAVVWYAYCAIHYLIRPEALERAVGLLTDVACPDATTAGAAYVLLDEALTDLGRDVLSERIGRLEASVQAEPGWSENRRRLALAYHEAGRTREGEEQLETAIANLLDAPVHDLVEASTHWCLTGRLDGRQELEADLRRIRG